MNYRLPFAGNSLSVTGFARASVRLASELREVYPPKHITRSDL
jgi:hypothetical protein